MTQPKKKGRGNPAGPPKRGRKGHSTIDQQKGFADWLEAQLLDEPRPTYDELEERLKKTGFYASRSALARWGLKFEVDRRDMKILLDKARVLANEDDPEDTLRLEKATAKLFATKIFDSAIGDGKKLTETDLALISAFARLQSSSSTRERASIAGAGKFRAAMRVLQRSLEEKLRVDPETLKKVVALIEKAAQEVSK